MQSEQHIVFEGTPCSKRINTRIEDEIGMLAIYFGQIIPCQVVISKLRDQDRPSDPYSVSVRLFLPNGSEVKVNCDHENRYAHADVNVAISNSFRPARWQLLDEKRKIRDDTSLIGQTDLLSVL